MAGAADGSGQVAPTPLPLLDTSVLVRYLIGEPPSMGERARALIDGGQDFGVTAVILAEAAHVLRRVYGRAREQIVDALLDMIQRERIIPHNVDRATLVEALRMCRPSGRVSIPDALLWAEARSSGVGIVYTFDRQFPSLGIEVRS